MLIDYENWIVFPEVEEGRGGNGIMMANVQRRSVPSKITFPVRNSLLKERLSMKTSSLVGVIVLEDFWLLRLLTGAQIYFVLQF